jgi:hypothetical protein
MTGIAIAVGRQKNIIGNDVVRCSRSVASSKK